MTDNKPNEPKETAKAFKVPEVPMKMPDMPDIDLHSSVKCVVNKTNSFLSTLEHQNNEVSNMVSSRIRPVASQAKYGITRVMEAYEMRKYYGPQIVAGSATAIGILVAARRGRVPGVFMGGLSGAGAYRVVYGESGMPDWK